jgi:type VI secretion system protein ImpH
MATPGRPESAGVENSELAELLEREPYRFDFFQAVRLLERLAPESRPVGRFVKPAQEVARFSANPALPFPASEIQDIERTAGAPARVSVNFMGVNGPLGVLPLDYSQLIVDRLREKDTAARDFLDLFNHRIISLFYQAWEKHRFAVAYERGELDRFSRHLLDLIGAGTEGLQNRQDVADESMIYYSCLLGLNTRSAAALEQILGDYFGVPIEVQQFVGAWHPMDDENRCRVGEESGPSEQLGWGAVVGDEIWDQQSRIRLRLGPLTFDEYRAFLPGGEAWRELRALTRFFTRDEFDIEVQFVLKREEAPACELGNDAAAAPRLGWSTWIKSAPLQRDPDETVLLLE